MKLYVGNLNYNTTEEGLKKFFETIGEVKGVNLIKNKFTGSSKGFGFVEFETDELGNKAIAELNGKELDNRNITVAVAKPIQKRDFNDNRSGNRNSGRRFNSGKYNE